MPTGALRGFRALRRPGWDTAKFRLVPTAMFAAPRAHHSADAQRDPTHQPKAAGQYDQHDVQSVINLRLNENLLVTAPRAVGSDFILFH